MAVVNLHHYPLMKVLPEDMVYIGRGSLWGNPYRVDVYGRQRALDLYKEYVLADPAFVERIKTELRGKTLACWCKPNLCHGDFLFGLANPESLNTPLTDFQQEQE